MADKGIEKAEAPATPSDRKKLEEAYKKQNPAKYEAKKKAGQFK